MKASPVLVRTLAMAGIALGAVAGVLGFVEAIRFASTPLLALAVSLVAGAAYVSGARRPDVDDETEALSFRRELATHFVTVGLTVVMLLLALVETLAIPAAMGQLEVFGEFALGFLAFYPLLTALLLAALAGAVILRAPARPEGPPAEKGGAFTALGIMGALVGVALAAGFGLLEGAGIRSERSVFVLAAALVGLFFFERSWLRLPTYAETTEWLEKEERLRDTGLLRAMAFGFLGIASLALLVAVLSGLHVLPAELTLGAVGAAMLALLGATFNVGVSHVVAALDIGEDALEARKKRRVVLNATTLGLTVLSLGLGLLTFFALLAQAAGVAIFNFLLEAFVAFYPVIFAVSLVPLIAAVFVRTRVQTEVKYSPGIQALAMALAAITIVLVFFGVFIGSGFAQGTGIQIENAVLVMGAGVLGLIHFVKARALLPSVLGLLKDAVQSSATADVDLQATIKRRMMITYVGGLTFVLAFAGYFVATTLGVVPSPESSLGTDLAFFLYLLVGIVLMVLVAMRYFQGVNIDPAWAKKRQKKDIGKKRLTSAQVTRYLILGFSIGFASILFVMGLMVQFKALANLGPITLEPKHGSDFFVFALLIGMGPYGWYQAREGARIDAINARFPEFLRDLAESQRSGMTLTEAVITASKGDYGVLSDEIRKMAAQIEWGVSFVDALERFGRRVDTQLIKRTVSLVVQASNAGGNVVDVLTAAADDAREIQMILKERKQAMSIYVMIIYIAFLVFLGVIAVLNAQFIPEVAKAVAKADGVSIGGLNFKAFDVQEFKTIFFHGAIIQGLGGGLVAGVMAGGKPVHGIRHSCILICIGYVLFRFIIG